MKPDDYHSENNGNMKLLKERSNGMQIPQLNWANSFNPNNDRSIKK